MIDPELKYCPQCDDEYRADIELCAACAVELITGVEKIARQESLRQRKDSRLGELTKDDDIVTIHKGSLHDLKHLEALFAKERIGALIVGDDSSCGKGCCPSVFYLQVRRDDARDAMGIINAEHRKATSMDGHETDLADSVFDSRAEEAVCPACNHTFSTDTATCPECGLCFG